jgi:hypothetical protein
MSEKGYGIPKETGVVPAKAGTQWRSYERHWIPAFAGMTAKKNPAGSIGEPCGEKGP